MVLKWYAIRSIGEWYVFYVYDDDDVNLYGVKDSEERAVVPW